MMAKEEIKDFFEQRGITLNWEQAQKFQDFYNILIKENNRINLTRITEKDLVMEEHFFDSVAGLKAGQSYMGKSLVDVGTGAGFPGVPIKILCPDLQLTLLESAGKKAAFLRLLVRELKLERVQVIQQRAEEFGQKNGREFYSWAVSRALAPLVTGAELALPLIKINGYFWAFKGSDFQEELAEAEKAIQRCGGRLEEIIPYFLHQGTMQRTVLVFKKVKAADSNLPRRNGVPQKRPIY